MLAHWGYGDWRFRKRGIKNLRLARWNMEGRVRHSSTFLESLADIEWKVFITFFCDLHPPRASGAVLLVPATMLGRRMPRNFQNCKFNVPAHAALIMLWRTKSWENWKDMRRKMVVIAVMKLVDLILLMACVYFNKSWVEMRGMHNILYKSRVIHFNCYLQCITYFFMAAA